MKFLTLIALALLVTVTPALAGNKTLIQNRDDVKIAAAPYCTDNNGLYRVRQNGDGGYWIICNDGTMIRAKIKVKSATQAPPATA